MMPIEQLYLRVMASLQSARTQYPDAQVSIDTRSLRPGDIFVALQGKHQSGDLFATEALERGASFVICGHGGPCDDRVVHVDNPLQTLTALAEQRRNMFSGTVIAITGSVGKTTLKEGVRHVLSPQTSVHANVKSFNNHIGVPLSLLNLQDHHKVCILEVGTNHAGEIESLTRLIRPTVSVLSGVWPAHIGNFKDLQELAQEKSQIFHHASVGVMSTGMPFYDFARQTGTALGCQRWVTYGSGDHDSLRRGSVEKNLEQGTTRVGVTLQGGTEFFYDLPSLQDHWIENSLLILATAYAAGYDIEQAAGALKTFLPLPGRGHVITFPKMNVKVIDESYNAALRAMQACLDALIQEPKTQGRKIAVLGHMAELGDKVTFYHEECLPLLRAPSLDMIFLAGPGWKSCYEILKPEGRPVYWKETVTELKDTFLQEIQDDDTILLKGANSMATWQVMTWLE